MKKTFLAFVGLLAFTCSQVQAIDAAKQAASSTRVEIQAEEAVHFDQLAVSLGQFDIRIGTPQALEPVANPQFVSPPGEPAGTVVSLASFGTATPYRSGGASFGATEAVS